MTVLTLDHSTRGDVVSVVVSNEEEDAILYYGYWLPSFPLEPIELLGDRGRHTPVRSAVKLALKYGVELVRYRDMFGAWACLMATGIWIDAENEITYEEKTKERVLKLRIEELVDIAPKYGLYYMIDFHRRQAADQMRRVLSLARVAYGE